MRPPYPLGFGRLSNCSGMLLPIVRRVDSRKFLQYSLLLFRKESFEAIRLHDLLALLWIHFPEMPQRFVYSNSAVLRKPLELMIGVTQFLTLPRCQAGPVFHPLQCELALIRRQAIEFAEPVSQCGLAGRRESFEPGVTLKSFFLLVKGEILVRFQPFEHWLRCAALVSFLDRVLFRGCRLQHDSPFRHWHIPVH